MQITRKILNKFNQGVKLCFNLEYCKQLGIPTPQEQQFLYSVRQYTHGNNNDYITLKDVHKFLKENNWDSSIL